MDYVLIVVKKNLKTKLKNMLTYVGTKKGVAQFVGKLSDWERFEKGEDTLEDIMGEPDVEVTYPEDPSPNDNNA